VAGNSGRHDVHANRAKHAGGGRRRWCLQRRQQQALLYAAKSSHTCSTAPKSGTALRRAGQKRTVVRAGGVAAAAASNGATAAAAAFLLRLAAPILQHLHAVWACGVQQTFVHQAPILARGAPLCTLLLTQCQADIIHQLSIHFLAMLGVFGAGVVSGELRRAQGRARRAGQGRRRVAGRLCCRGQNWKRRRRGGAWVRRRRRCRHA
jgi:hypothetical protein